MDTSPAALKTSTRGLATFANQCRTWSEQRGTLSTLLRTVHLRSTPLHSSEHVLHALLTERSIPYLLNTAPSADLQTLSAKPMR